eukprot:6010395-Ditylum_brightwellii.AAC.1
MRDPPPGIGVLGIGGIEKPMRIGTIIFQTTDSTLEWSTERKDDYGILSRGNYSIFLWNSYASQKLVPHP